MTKAWYIRFLLALGLAVLAACGAAERGSRVSQQVPGGDVALGRQAVETHGCVACHAIPGIRNASGVDSYVGPSLHSFARRSYIAGGTANTSDNLTLWLQSPELVRPGTAMPNLNINEAEARNIAAYLFTLR